MENSFTNIGRREFLVKGASAVLVVAAGNSWLQAEQLATLDVAYAGSMGSMMEGPVKAAAATTLKLEMHGRAQGASALAQLIVGGSIRPGCFHSRYAGTCAHRFARRQGRLRPAGCPHGNGHCLQSQEPFCAEVRCSSKGKADWWKILQEPGLRFGRTDPVTDPQGRNIIFTMMLAAKMYKQPDLVQKVLGPTINQKQIFEEPTVEARLQSGELDAASAYKIQPGPFNLHYVILPKEMNLSGQNVHADHPDITLSVGGKTYYPEPLIYYAAVLKDAPNPKGAAAFAEWLKGKGGQAIFRRYYYDAPGDASVLRA